MRKARASWQKVCRCSRLSGKGPLLSGGSPDRTQQGYIDVIFCLEDDPGPWQDEIQEKHMRNTRGHLSPELR